MTPEELTKAVEKFLSDAKASAAGGLTVAEFGALIIQVLRLSVAGLDAIPALDGPTKKAWAISCVAALFDAAADCCVPAVAWPVWWLARPVVRALVIAAASGALEQVLLLTRSSAPEAAA